MEYCEHGDLWAYLQGRKRKNISENRVWKMFIQITLGLAALHEKNIIHRDLKTLNIFLTKRDHVKIGDLGCSKITEKGGFVSNLVGTPFYLSPEVCEDKPYNSKSDIWSLGIILYEICALRHPFHAETPPELMVKIIKGKYERIPN